MTVWGRDILSQWGAKLEVGLPSISMIPRDWPLAIIDLKDCLFNLSLHPEDAPRFAFSVPAVNPGEPLQR